MAYTFGDTILDDHYNDFSTGSITGAPNHGVRNVNTVWGVGLGARGYGQSGIITPVSAGQTVTAVQWSTLLSRIVTAGAHQGTGLGGMGSISVGDTISAIATLTANITAIYNNSTNAATTGATANTNASGSATWNTQSTSTHIVTFGSVDQARYFFNAGGQIRLSFSRSGGSATAKNAEWTDLCNKSGTIAMGYTGSTKLGGSGAHTIAGSIGYYDLAGSDTQLFLQYADSSPYTANYLQVLAKTNGTAGANGANGNVLTFTTIYRDNATDSEGSGPGTTFSPVNGTLTTTCQLVYPSTAQLTNTWGSASVAPSMVQS